MPTENHVAAAFSEEDLHKIEEGLNLTSEARHRIVEHIRHAQRLADEFVVLRTNLWALECTPEQMKIMTTLMAAPNRALAIFQGKEIPT